MIRQPPVMSGARFPRLPFLGATHRYALIGAMLAALPAAADIGRTTAVVQQAQGTPPAQPTRVLIPRMDLFENERIQTDNRGVTQILFLDGTNLTVGPNSDLVIDRFIYDPDTSAGELATKLGRGVLRFVGGQVSKRGRASIATPVAVIGVRGGIAVVEHDETGGTNAVLLFGEEMLISGVGPAAETRRVTRPGFAVSVGSDGEVSNPARLPAERLESVLASLEGSEDSDGGSPSSPTRETVRRSAYVTTPAPPSVEETQGRAPVEPTPAANAAAETLVADSPPAETPVAETPPAETPVGGNPPAETPVAGSPPDGAPEDRSPALWRYGVAAADVDFGVPFLSSSLPSSVYDLTILKRAGTFEEVMRTGGYRFLRVRNQFSGQGANQIGAYFIYLGRITPNGPGLPVRFFGRSVSSARDATTSGTEGAYLIWGGADEDPARNPSPPFQTTTPPATFHTASGGYGSDGSRMPEFTWSEPHLDPSPFRSPAHVQWRLDEVAPLADDGPRGDRNWRGYATGLFEVRTSGVNGHEFGGTYSLRNRNGSPEDVIFVADADTGELGVVFRLGQVSNHELDQGATTNAAANFGVTTVEVNFGRRPNQPRPPGTHVSGTRGTYISDEAFAALSSRANFPDDSGDRLVSVNGRLVARQPLTRTWMAGNDAAPAEALLPDGVEYCDCPAARFGWWGGRIGLFTDPGQERVDSVFPGTFVVGDLPDIADIPTQGTAAYDGHAAAAVRNAGVAYAAVGGFSMDWNFATRTGEADITNLDGRDYTASALAAPLTNPRDFAGTFTQSSGPGAAAGPISGSFFMDGTDPARDVGGQFAVDDRSANYTAVGSFAATKN